MPDEAFQLVVNNLQKYAEEVVGIVNAARKQSTFMYSQKIRFKAISDFLNGLSR